MVNKYIKPNLIFPSLNLCTPKGPKNNIIKKSNNSNTLSPKLLFQNYITKYYLNKYKNENQ